MAVQIGSMEFWYKDYTEEYIKRIRAFIEPSSDHP